MRAARAYKNETRAYSITKMYTYLKSAGFSKADINRIILKAALKKQWAHDDLKRAVGDLCYIDYDERVATTFAENDLVLYERLRDFELGHGIYYHTQHALFKALMRARPDVAAEYIINCWGRLGLREIRLYVLQELYVALIEAKQWKLLNALIVKVHVSGASFFRIEHEIVMKYPFELIDNVLPLCTTSRDEWDSCWALYSAHADEWPWAPTLLSAISAWCNDSDAATRAC